MLLFDIGNTRVKWCYTSDKRKEFTGELLEGCFSFEDVFASVRRLAVKLEKEVLTGDTLDVGVASVGVGKVSEVLLEALQEKWSVNVVFPTVQRNMLGVVAAYSDLNRLGVDRWLALLAAGQLLVTEEGRKSSCLVIDAGSALTVDAMDEQGNHLGGWILPGYTSVKQALLGKADFAKSIQLNELSTVEGVGWGRSSESCVEQGFLSMYGGVVDRIYGQVKYQSDSVDLVSGWRVVLTGGDSAQLLPLLKKRFENVVERPHLVLEGIQLYLKEVLKSDC